VSCHLVELPNHYVRERQAGTSDGEKREHRSTTNEGPRSALRTDHRASTLFQSAPSPSSRRPTGRIAQIACRPQSRRSPLPGAVAWTRTLPAPTSVASSPHAYQLYRAVHVDLIGLSLPTFPAARCRCPASLDSHSAGPAGHPLSSPYLKFSMRATHTTVSPRPVYHPCYPKIMYCREQINFFLMNTLFRKLLRS